MLILTRAVGERLVFPDLGITITVAEIKGNKVRIGIDAPREVRVNREEVQRRIDESTHRTLVG